MIYKMNDELPSQILTNMLDNSDPEIDTREGTPTYTAMAPIADELALLYAELTAQERANFVVDEAGEVTMTGYKLDLFAMAWGEERKPGGKATGAVFIFADEPTDVPAGTRLFAPATVNVVFETDFAVTAHAGGVSVPVTAVDEGIASNLSAGTITGVIGNLEGILTVTNPAPTDYGFDAESDEEFAYRFLRNRQNEATSGNAAHYRKWATEVAGILDAYVIPVWNGPNTVKVIVLSANRDAPSPEKIQEVKDYINSIRPVFGDADPVTVEAAVEIPINIVATVELDEGVAIEDVQADYEQAMQDYLDTLAFGAVDTARVVRLENALLDVIGIIDIPSFTVNGAESNIVIPIGAVAIKGEVTLNVQT